MLTAEKVSIEIQKLPSSMQQEVLDFVEFLLYKNRDRGTRREAENWNSFSMSSALKGLEADEFPEYEETDFVEKWQ